MLCCLGVRDFSEMQGFGSMQLPVWGFQNRLLSSVDVFVSFACRLGATFIPYLV